MKSDGNVNGNCRRADSRAVQSEIVRRRSTEAQQRRNNNPGRHVLRPLTRRELLQVLDEAIRISNESIEEGDEVTSANTTNDGSGSNTDGSNTDGSNTDGSSSHDNEEA